MVTRSVFRKISFVGALALLVMAVAAPMAFAAEGAEGAAAGAATLGEGIKVAGVAIGAGLALLGGALATGRAQGSIGAGGMGAITEKPELFTNVLILVAIPETIVVFGFVIAVLIRGLAG
jgi:V/A-type H+-transporting ATPase subunit K